MLNKAKIEAIHSDLRKAMDEVAKKHNLSLAKTHVTYYTDSFRFSAEFGDKAELGDSNPIYVKDLKKFGWSHGFEAKHLNTELTWNNGKKYVVQGMKGRDKVVGKGTDGKIYLFPAVIVAKLLGVKSEFAERVTITAADVGVLDVKKLGLK